MAWYEQSVFYHIYPLGLTGAPKENPFGEPVHRLSALLPWLDHLQALSCSALYIGPLFESSTHGYDTADYRRLDSRLGTNEDLKAFVAACHQKGIRVILDAVFNHTGRDFFAFRDLKAHRENSRYLHWYRNVNFYGNNEYNDGFSYDNWGGYNLLCKLNLQNPEVRDYLLDTVRFWVEAFDIDGLRLDAADVLDFDFLRALRQTTEGLKADFWLMGEVIHGDYARWANEATLHSVTNYHLHKALYSAHNDHNYFEIAHTIRRQADLGLGKRVLLYNFVDNHDVERILTKLRDKRHFLPVHVLLYTLPGIPSLYYGSEFGVEGRKERGSDDSLRPCLDLPALEAEDARAPYASLCAALGKIHGAEGALWYGDYRELCLTTEQYAFARGDLVITVNNGNGPASFDLAMEGRYTGALTGERAISEGGRLRVTLPPCGGEIWIPEGGDRPACRPLAPVPAPAPAAEKAAETNAGKAVEKNAERSGGKNAERDAEKNAGKNAERDAGKNAGKDAEKDGEKNGEKNAEKNAEKDGEKKAGKNAGKNAEKNAEKGAEKNGEKTPRRSAVPKPYEEMTVEELQAEILAKLAANGPLTDRMKREVAENVYRNSLLNWVKSFR